MLLSKRLKKVLTSVLAIFVVAFCILATAPGHQLIVFIANESITGLNVKLGEGRLLSGTPIELEYQDKQLLFSAKELRVSLNWFSCATVCLDISAKKLYAKMSTVANSEPAEKDVEQQGTMLKAPFYIGLNSLFVEQIDATIDTQQVSLSQLQSSLNWRETHLTIDNLTLNTGKLSLPEQPKQQAVLITSVPAVVLEAPAIPLDIVANDLFVKKFTVAQGSQTTVLDDISVQARMNSKKATWRLATSTVPNKAILKTEIPEVSLNSQGSIAWSDVWQVHISNTLEAASNQLTFDAVGPLSQLQVALKSTGEYKSNFEGTFNLTKDNWPFRVQFDAQQLKFENLFHTPFESLVTDSVALNAEGTLNNYAIQMSLVGTTAPDSPFAITSKLQGSLIGIAIDNSQFRWRDSQANLFAQLGWENGLSGDVDVQINKIPLTLLSADYENAGLDAKIAANFALNGELWQANVGHLELNGQLFGKPLHADAKLKLNQDLKGELSRLNLDYGANKIAMSGELGKQLSLNGQLKLEHAADALLPVDIAMHGDIAISGAHQTPKIAVTTRVSHLKYGSLFLKDALFDLTSDSALNWETNASLKALKIQLGKLDIMDADILLQGDLSQHTLQVASKGDVATDIVAQGVWTTQQWQGQLSEATLSYLNHPITLLEPANISVSQASAQLDKQCWKFQGSKACISARQDLNTSKGKSDVEISQLLLEDFNPWLGGVTKLQGFATGALSFEWETGQLNHADGLLQLQQVKVTTTEGEQTHVLPIENVSTKLTSSRELASIDWQVNSSMLGRLKGLLEMPLTDISQPNASIEIVHMSLSPLSAVLSKSLKQAIALSGDISGQVNLVGDLRSPKMYGQINLRDMALSSVISPVALVSSSLDITLNDKQAEILGNLQAQQGGSLSVDGKLSWDGMPTASVLAKGHDFLISPQPNVEVSISPDLKLEYRQKKASLTGRLQIPFGRVEVEEMPVGVVQVSEDQIIVDEKYRQQSRSPIAYDIDLDVSVGDDFRVKAFGLDSYIAGQLDVTKLPASPLLASGELSLQEGRYRAFGQDLLIKTGLIGFNGALDRPYLNVRAIRNPEVTANDVEAGIELSGSISAPRFSIYSQPAMDQSQALAYLLNGEPLGEGENSNSTILTQLLLSQGLNRSEGLVSKTGEKLGFKDVSLGARGSGESTKVEVSGYLTPNVQVSYRVGVFDSLSEVAVRYRVFSKLYVEATSGLYDSIDLLYKFDWDPDSQ
ncbi:translocation/assembly module TamB domain-containing protein [Pseudoalteromonas sp. S16_S37]|uniref:translocation/assembly module TamB domain-containing protein n=1 Tax=Pseudoalteromonas sp. S16_S37 TaxID=2720228 RepID=UPI001EEF68B1|nr:translocation/assembly module TamB domain-containing protein [Pseudoalteromonas sp. S16_S37]